MKYLNILMLFPTFNLISRPFGFGCKSPAVVTKNTPNEQAVKSCAYEVNYKFVSILCDVQF